MSERHHFIREHDLALPGARRIPVSEYWTPERAEWWRRQRRLAQADAMPRIGGVENPHVYSRPAMRMPDMREGAERLQRKRARKHAE